MGKFRFFVLWKCFLILFVAAFRCCSLERPPKMRRREHHSFGSVYDTLGDVINLLIYFVGVPQLDIAERAIQGLSQVIQQVYIDLFYR